jgi:hypothetical protein
MSVTDIDNDCVILHSDDSDRLKSNKDRTNTSLESTDNDSLRDVRRTKRGRKIDECLEDETDVAASPRSASKNEKNATPATRTKKQAKQELKNPGLITSFFKSGPAASKESNSVKTGSAKTGSEDPAITAEKSDAAKIVKDTCAAKLFSSNAASLDKSVIDVKSDLKSEVETCPDLELPHEGKVVGHITAKLKDHQAICLLLKFSSGLV